MPIAAPLGLITLLFVPYLGLLVALALVALAAVATPSRELVIPLASAWSVAALLHTVYHARNLDGFGAGDAIALIAVLGAALALPALAIVIIQREWSER